MRTAAGASALKSIVASARRYAGYQPSAISTNDVETPGTTVPTPSKAPHANHCAVLSAACGSPARFISAMGSASATPRPRDASHAA